MMKNRLWLYPATIVVAAAAIFAVATTRNSSIAPPPHPPKAAPLAATSVAINEDVRIASAVLLKSEYDRSPLADWGIRVKAAGSDCRILLIHAGVIMDDTMIEAMHYGAGSYAVYEGGVQRFYLERSFRGVAYTDSSEKVWTFGTISEAEAAAAEPCH
jgi:hypothetical protein